MARRRIIAGNWKMNKTPSEAVALCEELKDLVKETSLHKDPFALCPVWATGTYHSPHMRKPNF